ncbi:MAG TPA: ATP-binding protein, partial [Candidatus Dormibacteraeota bacterium]|nr:ATP-binding protein [Candidatus Dormibacteraeota bacterium]
MPVTRYVHSFDIKTALKIVRHISSGIYRDLSGSLKELVSNSFDAQATEVEIWSGAPKFDTITVKDNGQGINEEVLTKAF